MTFNQRCASRFNEIGLPDCRGVLQKLPPVFNGAAILVVWRHASKTTVMTARPEREARDVFRELFE